MYRKKNIIMCVFLPSIGTLAFAIHAESWNVQSNYDLGIFEITEEKSPARVKHDPAIRVRLKKNDKEGDIQNPVINVKYNVGDNLLFYCEHDVTDADYRIAIYHERSGMEWTVAENIGQLFKYNITADTIDNNSKIYCVAYSNNTHKSNITSSEITLSLDESGDTDEDIKKITYSSETYHNCNVTSTTQNILLDKQRLYSSKNVSHLITAANNGSTVICSDLSMKYQSVDGYSTNMTIYTRIIYNKFLYILDTTHVEPQEVNKIGLITGITGTIILLLLVTMFLLMRCRKKEVVTTPHPDLELYASPNQVVYAELALADTTRNTNVNKADTPYAEIVGFLAKKPPNK